MSEAPFPDSTCHRCAHLRVVGAARSTFLRCEEGRPPKYPAQPVRTCPFFQPAVKESPARGLAVLLVLGLALAAGRADAACPEVTRAWARACHPSLETTLCDEGVVVVQARLDDVPPLSIEVRHAPLSTFRRVGEVGYSPVAELADWNLAPPQWRELLDTLTSCPPPPFAAARPVGPDPRRQQRLPGSPWRALVGFALLAAALAQRRRLWAWTRGRPWLLVLAPPLTFGLRALLFDEAFFHQNGQGPAWVEMALCQPSPYGPGFRELFGAVAAAGGAAPEHALFVAQALLLSLGPLLAFVLVRAVGGSPWLAGGAALALAVNPLLGRISRSETYFASTSLLVLAAAVAVTAGARGGRWRFAAGVLAAGFLGAQASRVHAVSWLPLALVPACVLVLRGASLRRRALQALVAALGIGAVVGAVSGATLLDQLRDELVTEWGGHTAQHLALPTPPWAALLGAALVFFAARSRRRGAVTAAALLVGVVAAARVSSVAPWSEVVKVANAHVYSPVLVFVAAGVVLARPRARLPALLGLAVLVAGLFAWRWQAWTQLPTDALEARAVLGWRARLTPDDTVVYLERVERRIQHLPVYQCAVPGQPRVIAAQWPDRMPKALPPGRLFVIETSLCATREGKAPCAELTQGLDVEWLDRKDFPARASDYQAYEADRVELRLGRRRE